MQENSLPTNIFQAEPIHRVLQGEGPNIGKKMLLLRLFTCDVQCPSCDSQHTWHPDHLSPLRQKRSIEELADELTTERNATGITHLLISGGEPHLQIPNIKALMEALQSRLQVGDKMWQYDIETTGRRDWSELHGFFPTIQFNLSPKIAALVPGKEVDEHLFFSTTVPLHKPWIHWDLKVVVRKDQALKDMEAVHEFRTKYNIPKEKTFLMPFGMHRDQIIEESEFWIEYCLANGYQFSPRMHVLIYDNKRLV